MTTNTNTYVDFIRLLNNGQKLSEEQKEVIGLEFHDKIVRNDVKGCEELIRQGVSVNDALKFSHAITVIEKQFISKDIFALPLHVSCIYRRPKIVELLTAKGANPNMKDKLGRLPSQLLLMYWPRVMFSKDKLLPEEERQYQTYLKLQHLKCRRCLEIICQNGASVDETFGENKDTLLHLAAKFNIPLSVDILVSHGANLEAKDAEGLTPLLLGCSKNYYFEVVEELIKVGANISTSDPKGKTALHYACQHQTLCRARNVEYLIQNGANVNQQDEYGFTALHEAADCGKEAAIRVLLDHGADPSIKSKLGRTPLFLLLDKQNNRNRVYSLEILLNATIQINLKDNGGTFPLLVESDTSEDDWTKRLVRATEQPSSLQRQCRCHIRWFIGLKHLTSSTVQKLPIGKRLQDYVLYSNGIYV